MRVSRDEMLMRHALVAAERGTCSRLQVGAVFSKDGRIITTGYNGTPSGQPHCTHECNCGSIEGQWPPHYDGCTSLTPCIQASHAERNGIDFAAKHGLSLDGSELHVTHAPCTVCAGSIINVGVVKVTYREEYRLPHGVELLKTAGIETEQLHLDPVMRVW